MKREEIYSLLDYFQASNIGEFSIKDGEFELSLSKAGAPVVMAAGAAPVATVVNTPIAAGSAVAVAEEVQEGEAITAPLIGTFYSAPSPESDPFVTVGSKVKKGDPLCIVEAMKMLNELPAPYDCEILKIHANNAELVGYGDTLFSVKRSV